MSTSALRQFASEGEPPYCEMTLRADDDMKDIVHEDLEFAVTFKGVKAAPIVINRTYEQPSPQTMESTTLAMLSNYVSL